MMLRAIVASTIVGTLMSVPHKDLPSIEPRKIITSNGSGDDRHHVVRYFDAELNVACYVTSGGYRQARIACIKL